MRLAVIVSGGVPHPTTGGGNLTAWTTVTELVARGHEVLVAALHDPEHFDPKGAPRAERVEQLRRQGVSVVSIPSHGAEYFRTRPRTTRERLRRAVRPLDEELLPHLVDAAALADAVEEFDPDAAFVYAFEALAASRTLRAPRLVVLGDPPQLTALYRWRAQLPSPRALRGLVRLQAVVRQQPRLLVRLANECDAQGAFAAHHAEWLRCRGVPNCRYLHTPVPDPVGAAWRDERAARLAERPRLLLLGHLKGVVTLDGLRVVAHDLLPRLERALGPGGFDVRIGGGYDPPAELRRALSRPSVTFLGHLDDPAEEIQSAHAMLVPNTIPLGIRVRIVTGFSYGACVISHTANVAGIPELVHEENALLGASPDALVDGVLRILREPRLREALETGGRATYERWFAPGPAVGEIERLLEQIAVSPVAA